MALPATVEDVASMTQDDYTNMTEDEYTGLAEEVSKAIDARVEAGTLVERMSPTDAMKAFTAFQADIDTGDLTFEGALEQFKESDPAAWAVLSGRADDQFPVAEDEEGD